MKGASPLAISLAVAGVLVAFFTIGTLRSGDEAPPEAEVEALFKVVVDRVEPREQRLTRTF
ncbi:MAG: hypothetical protein AAFV51_14900, partial [Pseudomonadota bacterium]